MISAARYVLAAALAALVPVAALAQSTSPRFAVPLGQRTAPDAAPLSRESLRNARPTPMPELSEDEARRLFRGKLPPRDTTTPRPEPMAAVIPVTAPWISPLRGNNDGV